MRQEEYMKHVADSNLECFLMQGHATPGHNGPHGHLETPVRNTAHYLIIYAYLFKKYNDSRYLEVCKKFAEYLVSEQEKSVSGAIAVLQKNSFDCLNGLIGQAWVIEALLYYYELSQEKVFVDVAAALYKSQRYDYKLHLWSRIDLDGTDLGVDVTYNHQVWFAACACKLADYGVEGVNEEIKDFLNNGTRRDFKTSRKGLLSHVINVKSKALLVLKLKKVIKVCLTPIKRINPKKFDYLYIQHGYQIFDMYGFSILQQRYPDMPFFCSRAYKQAVSYACDIKQFDLDNSVGNTKYGFNVYGYSYNSPAFEYPYLSLIQGEKNVEIYEKIYETQKSLMYDDQTKLFSRNNPDITTWNARTYEIVRYLDAC